LNATHITNQQLSPAELVNKLAVGICRDFRAKKSEISDNREKRKGRREIMCRSVEYHEMNRETSKLIGFDPMEKENGLQKLIYLS